MKKNLFSKIKVTILLLVIVLLNCESGQFEKLILNNKLFEHYKIKEYGKIITVEMPQYQAYYVNLNEEISSKITVQNIDNNLERQFKIKLHIIDPLNKSHLINEKIIIVKAAKKEEYNLKGILPQNIISGWFGCKIEVWHQNKLNDLKIKNNVFSAFRDVENYEYMNINTLNISKHMISDYDDVCTDSHSFGYDPANVSTDNGKLKLRIPASQTYRQGGEAILKQSYLFGLYKAIIKMNVDHPYTLGAFWLWDETNHKNSIVMEVWKDPNSEFYLINCFVWKDEKEQLAYIHKISINPNSDFIEYKILWEDNFIKFFFDGSEIIDARVSDKIKIPVSAMNLAFSYRMNPWSGGEINCFPSLPNENLDFFVDWAAW